MGPGSRLSHLVEAVPELRSQPEWRTADHAPWLVNGALDFERLVERLLTPFLERLLQRGEREAAARLCAFLDRLVTDRQDERLVNQ